MESTAVFHLDDIAFPPMSIPSSIVQMWRFPAVSMQCTCINAKRCKVPQIT